MYGRVVMQAVDVWYKFLGRGDQNNGQRLGDAQIREVRRGGTWQVRFKRLNVKVGALRFKADIMRYQAVGDIAGVQAETFDMALVEGWEGGGCE